MIIELVGLPGAGKTRIAEALRERGAVVVGQGSRPGMVLRTLLFELQHPWVALSLATAILRHSPAGMRYSLIVNGYFGAAAKWVEAQRISGKGKVAVIDQGHAQLIVSLAGFSPRLISKLPKPDHLVLVEAPADVRRTRMHERGRTPRLEAGEHAAAAWDAQAGKALEHAKPVLNQAYPRFTVLDGRDAPEENAALLYGGAWLKRIPAPLAKRMLLWVCWLAALLPRRGAAVLMYHAVDASGWRLSIPPVEFERQIQYLAKHCTPVPLVDVVAHVREGKELPQRSVALTFDDGYHDLVETVLPIIQKYRVPITVFLTTDLKIRTNSLGLPRVTVRDLEVLRASGLVDLQSHGRSHPHLPHLTPEVVREEVVGAKEDLAQQGVQATYFAYPFGDRAPFVENIVREAGYEAAFSISEGFVRSGDNPFRLKRIQVDNSMDFGMFKARLTNALVLNRTVVNIVRNLRP